MSVFALMGTESNDTQPLQKGPSLTLKAGSENFISEESKGAFISWRAANYDFAPGLVNPANNLHSPKKCGSENY